MRKFFALIMALCLFVGCAGLPSVCDDITEGSILCKISKEQGVRLEDVGNVLIIANAIAIGEGAYSIEQAIDVMKKIRALLDDPISYIGFKNGLKSTMTKYPGLIEIGSIYIDQFTGTRLMSNTDSEMLITFLDNRIKNMEAA